QVFRNSYKRCFKNLVYPKAHNCDVSKVGLVKPGVPMEIVLNRESHRKSPAIVAFRNGERSFSETAAHVLVKFASQTHI
ncbi:MAG: hypothetical protein AAF368_18245, partial [Planctomycetota bacterium]